MFTSQIGWSRWNGHLKRLACVRLLQFSSICAILVLVAADARALGPSQTIKQLYLISRPVRHGLESTNYDIAQMADEFLWLSSRSGLFLFSRVLFERFTAAEGRAPRDSSVYCLSAFFNGSLLTGWRSAFVSRLKDGPLKKCGPDSVWFKTICILVALLILGLIVAWRVSELTLRAERKLSDRFVERERLARELHDTLLQGFQGLVLKFQTAAAEISENGPARAMMESALNRADEVLVESRNRLRPLRSEDVTVNDLLEALQLAGEQFTLDHPAEFSMSVEGVFQQLHPVIRDQAYLIGREALANAFMHSQGTSIECNITFQKRSLILGIRDNGMGIYRQPLEPVRSAHWGLSGMRERSRNIMATLEIWSRSNAGTEVELKIPSRVAYVHGYSARSGLRREGQHAN